MVCLPICEGSITPLPFRDNTAYSRVVKNIG
jgi:hypothetical protein